MPRNRPGQLAGEIYLFAGFVVFLTLPVTIDVFVRALGVRGWHWLWFAPLLPVVYLLVLHALIIASAWLGDLAAAAGIARHARPRRRTGFFVLAILTTAAAWAAGTHRWIAVPGTTWLVATALNLAAAVWRSMEASEHPRSPA